MKTSAEYPIDFANIIADMHAALVSWRIRLLDFGEAAWQLVGRSHIYIYNIYIYMCVCVCVTSAIARDVPVC